MGRLYLGLLHYPIRGRHGETIATAITGIDIHDIARSARTYGVHRFFVVTPLRSQQEIARRILRYWLELKEDDPSRRAEALQGVRIVDSLEASIEEILAEERGTKPRLIGTSARTFPKRPRVDYDELRERLERDPDPVYLLLGTGWGLADAVIERVDAMLRPIYGVGEYNHLSVRAAAAIILDRLRGRREHELQRESESAGADER